MDAEDAHSAHQPDPSSDPAAADNQTEHHLGVQSEQVRGGERHAPALIEQGTHVTDFEITAPSSSFQMVRWIAYKKSIYLNVLPPIGTTMSVAVFDDHVYLRFKAFALNPFGTRLAPTFSRQYSRTVASSHVFLLIKPGLVAIAY